MAGSGDPRGLVDKILSSRAFSERELDRIFKLLCKHTHPDLTGKDGSEFIRLGEAYKLAKRRLGGPAPQVDFDPRRIIDESGFAGELTPRGALFLSLYRWLASGLHSHRIRTSAVLKERNTLIIRTSLYWAERYDPLFADIFISFNRNLFTGMRASEELKVDRQAKRLLVSGLAWFLRFQDTGRPAAAQLARDRLAYARLLLGSERSRRAAGRDLCVWLLGELENPPEVLLLDGR